VIGLLRRLFRRGGDSGASRIRLVTSRYLGLAGDQVSLVARLGAGAHDGAQDGLENA